MTQTLSVIALKSTVEALLSDLQNTTAVLKQAHTRQQFQQYSVDEEPIYEPQQQPKLANVSTMPQPSQSHGLNDLENMLDGFSKERNSQGHSGGGGGGGGSQRPTVDSLLHELDSAVPNGDSRQQSYSSPRSVTTSPQVSAQATSNDLDHLMSSLNDMQFRNQSHQQPQRPVHATNNNEASYAQPVKSPRSPQNHATNPIDAVLGSLDEDMQKQGIKTVPKGDCANCGKPIVGQVVIALGKMWHPEHFQCAHCGEELGHKNFFERGQKAYCETDYHNLFSPRCGYCNGPIKDKCVTALERTWHPEHFFCAQCGKHFGEERFHEKDGKAYCRNDYFTLFAPRCRGCQRPIMQNYITALNTQWHPECFVCQDCNTPFQGGSFFDHDGKPFCETHYHQKRGSLCAACLKPISGRCVSAMGRKFHPEHFICHYCNRQLNKGTFKEHEQKPYCHQCFGKLLQ